MQLPVALQPWRPWLQWLEPDQALALGAVLQRLDPLLGEFRGRSPSGEPEPVGIDDLRRRGPYHRLVLSEWALNDELPDEFLRRAAQGEHLFLSPRLEARHGDALNVAVFDAGPAQLGGARLVHVALWILLARRALLAHIPFAWGVLHRPGELHDADTPAQLKKLLAARTLARPGEAATARWEAHLDTLAPGERWWIGAPGARPAACTHQATIRRGFDAELTVALGSAQARRSVALALPSSGAAARLLQGHFAREATVAAPKRTRTRHKLSLKQPPVFGRNGATLAVPVLGENAALVFRPTSHESRKRTGPRQFQWPMGHELLAGALHEKTFGGIYGPPQHRWFWNLPGFGAARTGAEPIVAAPGLAHWLSALWFPPPSMAKAQGHFYLLDTAGTLHAWASRTGHPNVEASQVADINVLAIGYGDAHRFAYVRHGGEQLELIGHGLGGGGITRLAGAHVADKPERGFLATRMASHRPQVRAAWCVLMPRGSLGDFGAWLLFTKPEHVKEPAWAAVKLSAGAHVVGVVMDPPGGTGPAIVALRADRRSVVAADASGTTTIFASEFPIACASVATDADVIALVTEDRALTVLTDDKSGAWHAWTAESGGD